MPSARFLIIATYVAGYFTASLQRIPQLPTYARLMLLLGTGCSLVAMAALWRKM
jgi:hypothetical protein